MNLAKLKMNMKNEESDMRKIFVKDEVGCSYFIKYDNEPKRKLISKYSIEFEQFVANDGIKKLEEKVVAFPKVQSTTMQVFVTKGLDKSNTNDLNFIVKTDIDISCVNHVWSESIDNS